MSNVTRPPAAMKLSTGVLYSGVGLTVVLVLGLIIYPSLLLVGQSFWADQITLANYQEILSQTQTYQVLGNSLVVSGTSTVIATFLGTLLAWLVARTDLPWQRFWRAALLVPYMIPPFIGAIAWTYLLGRAGYLNKIWMAVTQSSDPLVILSGPIGIIFVMTLFSFPIAYLVTLGPLEQMDPVLEEAARMSGANPLQTLKDIVAPLILPSMGSAALLIFLLLMANFGIPSVIGLPDRYYVMTTQIYSLILNYSKAYNLQLAAALAMVLVLIAILGLQTQHWILRSDRYQIVTGRSTQSQPLALKGWKPVVLVGLGVLLGFTVIAPLIAILLNSLLRALGLPLAWENLTLKHYHAVLWGVPKVRRAIINSLLLATGSASGIAALSMLISYLVVRLKIRGSRWLEAMVTIPYAIPGTVVALALILAFLNPIPGLRITLYNTIWILFIAYLGRFLTFGLRSISAGLAQIDPELEQAARVCGAAPTRVIWDVTLPLIRSSAFAGWFLAFVPCLAELTVSILLASVGTETLGTTVFGLYEEGKVGMTAALSLLVTGLIFGIYGLARWATRGQASVWSGGG